MRIWRVLTLTIAVVWIGVPLLDGFMTWLAPAAWAAVMVLAPPTAAALAAVLYFQWRARLKSRIVGEAGPDEELAAPA